MKLLEQLSAEISEAVEEILPSIVEVETSGTRSRLNPRRLLDGDEYPWGSGAGFVLRPDGVIITNHHVVVGATRLCVKLQDGRSFEPEVRGSDPVSDVAVLRVPAADLRPARLSPERRARLGEMVIAVGHPLGLTATATLGIVSAAARLSPSPAGHLPGIFIQTDASISPETPAGRSLDATAK